MQCCICDDNLHSLRMLENMFYQSTARQNWLVETFSETDALMLYLYKHKPELLIMDIEINGSNGIELVGNIHEKYPGIIVIFVSAYIRYCSSVYETDHIYFLLKPVDEQNFNKAIAKVQKKLEEMSKKQLLVKNRNTVAYIPYEDIIYIENSGRKVRIQTVDSLIETYMSIEALSETLDSRFIHCHKSYIVNMDCIKAKNKNMFVLKNGYEISISQSRLSNTKAAYLTYLGDKL